MPLLRHGCRACGAELLDLYGPTDPGPQCCGEAMRLLMPRRVVGRCMPDSDGVHAGSGWVRAQPSQTTGVDGRELNVVGNLDDYAETVPESRMVSSPVDPTDESIVAPPSGTGAFAKDYEQCSAAERDARWHDGAQALAAWATRQLEAKGETPKAARDTAAEAAQQSIAKARSESTRADGLT